MTPLEAREAVLARWVTAWVDDNHAERTPTVLDNDPYDPSPEAVTAFCRLTIREVDSIQRTMGPPGGRRFDRHDLVLIHIHTAAAAGREVGDTLGELARAVFEAARFETVVGSAGRVQPGDVVGRWSVTTVQIPIRYTETK